MSKKKKSSSGHESEDQRMVNEIFYAAVLAVNENDKNPGAVLRYDLGGAPLKRRKSAAHTMLPRVVEKYGHYYTNAEDVKHDFLVHCAAHGNTADEVDLIFHTTLAAALWMLDELKRARSLEEAYPYFSQDTAAIEEEDIPFRLADPCHDNLVIKGMMNLIHERDELMYEENLYINTATARRKKPEAHELVDKDPKAMSPRERFNAVMSMIPPRSREQAVQHFEEKLWEFLDTVFSVSSKYANELAEIGAQLDEYDEIFFSSMDWEDENKKPSKIPSAAQQVPVLPDLDMRTSSIMPNSEKGDRLRFALKLRRLIEAYTRAGFKRTELLTSAHSLVADIFRPESDDLGREEMEAIWAFEVDDPYEICFAYLYLLESGSDLPWVYNTALAVVLAACRKFPWAMAEHEEEYLEEQAEEQEQNGEEEDDDDDDPTEDGNEDKGITPEAVTPDREEDDDGGGSEAGGETMETREEIAARYRHKYLSDLYSLKYSPDTLYTLPNKDCKINLPQVVYALSGTLMPRDTYWFEGTAEDLVKYGGMEPGLAQGIELYCQIADETQNTSWDWDLFLRSPRFKRINRQKWEEYRSPEKENKEEEQNLEELTRQLREERDKNAKLRQALYEATKEAEQQKNIAETTVSAAEADRSELALLREAIYTQANSQEFPDEPEEEDTVTFPYMAKRRTVVFGGHDSWLKKIQPMLPNVVFIKDQNPNAEMIRRADAIWLQPNALSHRMFYKIIDIVRTYHIPIYYFTDSSAKKCALNFVESELEAMEEK